MHGHSLNTLQMLRYLTLSLIIPISTLAAFSNHDFFKGLDFTEIQEGLSSDECYLFADLHKSYFISNQLIDSFSTNTDSIRLAIDGIRKEVTAYQNKPFTHDPHKYNGLCQDLYTLLISPIENYLTTRIFVVPIPELRSLPWNALSPRDGQFLIDKYEVTLSYKEGLRDKLSAPSRNHTIHFIAPEFKGDLTLETGNERQQLERLLPFTIEKMNQSSLIHVGSHGFWDARLWESSGIMIGENKVLDNAKVSSLCLKSKLVFLNICNGARISENDLSMVDAFQEAGAHAIVGALWEIDDRMAVSVSLSFYTKFLEGHRTSQALRESLLNFRNQWEGKNALNPIQWSAYQVYGQNLSLCDQSAVTLKKATSMVLSFCTSISLFFYYFGSKIKSLIEDYNLV